MSLEDFQLWKNLSSCKLKKQTPKLYISKITEILVKRSDFHLYYKCNTNEVDWKELDFLQKKIISDMPMPSIKAEPNGFEKQKVETIIKSLGDIIPENRRQFWLELPEKR